MEELRGALRRLVQRLQRQGPGAGIGGGETGGGGGGELQEDAGDDEERQHAASQVSRSEAGSGACSLNLSDWELGRYRSPELHATLSAVEYGSQLRACVCGI